ncbi:MAG: hypothetical protein Q9222_002544 [Ikaeria aurantiellina]
MVSFKKLFLGGLAIISAANLSIAYPSRQILQERSELLERQDRPVATLEYSPQGRFRLLLSLSVSQALTDAFYSSSTDLAAQLAADFKDWARQENRDIYGKIVNSAVFGGLFDKDAGGGK